MSDAGRESLRRAVFDRAFLEDLGYWVDEDRKVAQRLLKLVTECLRSPFDGTGKPEPLKHELKGCWSRRLTKEHRLVYQVSPAEVVFLQGRFHYR